MLSANSFLSQGELVHTLQLGKKGDHRPPIVYSLAYHPSQPTLLTAGSHGPVIVWKPIGWQDEKEEQEQEQS